MPITPLTNYPTLENVANLLRTLVNDDGAGATGTVGEGQIVVDNQAISTKVLNALNSSLEWLYGALGNVGDPTLVADNYIVLNLPVVHGVNGIGSPDPSAQVSLGYAGFFDGTSWNSNYLLPTNLFEPIRIWQRMTGSNLPYMPLPQAQGGLDPNWQDNYLGAWEWRGDGIWMNGSIQNCDIRIRSRIKLPLFNGPNINFSTTYIPVQSCVNALAFKTASIIESSLSNPEGATGRAAEADQHLFILRNSKVRRAQGVPYHRPGYQEDRGMGLASGFAW